MERLDKVLSNLGYGSRKEIKQAVRKGLIEVNGELVKDNGMQVDPENDRIIVNGEEIFYRKFIYLLTKYPIMRIVKKYKNKLTKNKFILSKKFSLSRFSNLSLI